MAASAGIQAGRQQLDRLVPLLLGAVAPISATATAARSLSAKYAFGAPRARNLVGVVVERGPITNLWRPFRACRSALHSIAGVLL